MGTRVATPDQLIFTPQQSADLTLQSLKEERENGRASFLRTGIPQLDDHYVMHRRSTVNGIIAPTSHGKTSLMGIEARNFVELPDLPFYANLPSRKQLALNEIIIFATWEDSVETLGASFLANATRIPVHTLYNGSLNEDDWEKIALAAIKRAETPLWLIGHSDQDEAERGRPRLTMTDIWRVVEFITAQGYVIRAIFLDYLQRINRQDMRGDLREQYMGIMDKVRDLSLAFRTDCIVGSQVGREVVDRKGDKIPQINDAQETSNFEQTCDGMVSLLIPFKAGVPETTQITIKTGNDPAMFCSKDLMFIRTLKQKKGPAPETRAVSFDPIFNEIRTFDNNKNK
jgi:replicative DNA helicase